MSLTRRRFRFDSVYGPTVHSDRIYADLVAPLVADFIGHKSSVFVAFGPQRSGKDFTMRGDMDPSRRGLLLSFAIDALVAIDHSDDSSDLSLQLSLQSVSSDSVLDVVSSNAQHQVLHSRIPQQFPSTPISRATDVCDALVNEANLVAAAQKVRRESPPPALVASFLLRSGNCVVATVTFVVVTSTPAHIRKQRLDALGKPLPDPTFRESVRAAQVVRALCDILLHRFGDGEGAAPSSSYREAKLTMMLRRPLAEAKRCVFLAFIPSDPFRYDDALSAAMFAQRLSSQTVHSSEILRLESSSGVTPKRLVASDRQILRAAEEEFSDLESPQRVPCIALSPATRRRVETLSTRSSAVSLSKRDVSGESSDEVLMSLEG